MKTCSNKRIEQLNLCNSSLLLNNSLKVNDTVNCGGEKYTITFIDLDLNVADIISFNGFKGKRNIPLSKLTKIVLQFRTMYNATV